MLKGEHDLGCGDELTDPLRYLQAVKIANYILGRGEVHNDRRYNLVDSRFGQTHRGLYLMNTFSGFTALCTPWGLYSFATVAREDPEILERFGAVYLPGINMELQVNGLAYAINRDAGGVYVPAPLPRPISQYVPAEEAVRTWKSFSRKYREQLDLHPVTSQTPLRSSHFIQEVLNRLGWNSS